MLDQHALAQKYQIMPGRETVTFTPWSTAGAGTPVSVPGAYRRVLRRREENRAEWIVDREQVEWILPNAALAPTVPQLLDTVTETVGDVWTVTTISHELLGAVWRLGCVRRRPAA
jgi:hypothetical protein